MKRDIDLKVKEILQKAIFEADTYNDSKFRPEHIMIAIIDDSDNQCVDVLKKLNTNLDELYDKLIDYAQNNPITPRIGLRYNDKAPPSELTIQVLNCADKEAELMNNNCINIIHIMLGILDTDTPATKILRDLNITKKKFYEKIKADSMNKEDYDFEDDAKKRNLPPLNKKKVNSKTPVLDNFCRDITKAAEEKLLDPIVGREKELRMVSIILSRRKKNNPVLIGEPGTGKCLSINTLVAIRNKTTNEVIKTTIGDFINTISNTD